MDTVKGVLMAASALRADRWGVQGVGWALTKALGPG